MSIHSNEPELKPRPQNRILWKILTGIAVLFLALTVYTLIASQFENSDAFVWFLLTMVFFTFGMIMRPVLVAQSMNLPRMPTLSFYVAGIIVFAMAALNLIVGSYWTISMYLTIAAIVFVGLGIAFRRAG